MEAVNVLGKQLTHQKPAATKRTEKYKDLSGKISDVVTDAMHLWMILIRYLHHLTSLRSLFAFFDSTDTGSPLLPAHLKTYLLDTSKALLMAI